MMKKNIKLNKDDVDSLFEQSAEMFSLRNLKRQQQERKRER